MKGKKLLSMFTAGALAVTMVMPVMAADGGEMDVTVTTKTAVIRVEVPTTMAIAVDQFMMADAGTQISSSEFTMANKSAVDVKVEVTSTATLAATTKLMDTKAGAKDSTEEGEAWLGVAAQSAADSYDDPTTDTSDDSDPDNPVADTPETLATLTEANANVATFVTGDTATEGKAAQMFYLKKGTGNVDYKMLNAGEDASKIDYAQFYELTAETVADQDALDALIAAKDVYVAAAAAANGQALTLVEKGGSHTKGATDVYYTAATNATAKKDLNAANLYVYGGTATADATDGSAAFRYIGVLSGSQETWTKDDISAIKIKYDIIGVTADKYAEVADDCSYGLYVEKNKNIVESDGTNDIVIYYTGAKPASVTIAPLQTTGSATTAMTKSDGTEIKIDDEKVTITAAFVKTISANTQRGKGTYKVTIGTTDTTVTFK